MPDDPYWTQQWGLAKVNAAAAWSITTGAPSTVVAVLDTGVTFSHPDLQGATLQNAIAYAEAHDVLVVAAAGNNASNAPFYPADYPGVLSIAGTQSNDTLYSWSNYGSWVRVGAPGCDYTTTRTGGYGSFCGTSAATPVVAGLAGLARSLDTTATAGRIQSAIEGSAANIASAPAPIRSR